VEAALLPRHDLQWEQVGGALDGYGVDGRMIREAFFNKQYENVTNSSSG
jgi:hypothetical protein